jgi:hypothetical protein
MGGSSHHWLSHLPFYYGWLIVGVGFVTMAIGVTTRTSFSLLMPPLIDEFGWHRGFAAAHDPRRAVCVMPGTGLAFAGEVACLPTGLLGWRT